MLDCDVVNKTLTRDIERITRQWSVMSKDLFNADDEFKKMRAIFRKYKKEEVPEDVELEYYRLESFRDFKMTELDRVEAKLRHLARLHGSFLNAVTWTKRALLD